MVIQDITKSLSTLMIKEKPYLHVPMELMLNVEFLLDYVMHPLLSKDA